MLKPLLGVHGLSWNGDVHVGTGKMLCGAAAAKSLEVLLDEGWLGNMSPTRWMEVWGSQGWDMPGGQAVVSLGA